MRGKGIRDEEGGKREERKEKALKNFHDFYASSSEPRKDNLRVADFAKIRQNPWRRQLKSGDRVNPYS